MADKIKNSLTTKREQAAKQFYGGSGTELYGGYLTEDYLNKLNGPDRADTFEEMRRGDAQIKKILSVIKGPIRGARFEFEPSGDTEKHKKAADFIKWNWSKNPFIKIKQFVNEQLTMLDFGCSVHEYVFAMHKHPVFGPIHCLGGLGFRKQSTIYEWLVNENGILLGIRQIASGDGVPGGTITAAIPANRLIINVNDQEGDNYEGTALLRACYGPWFRKKTYLKLIAIGMEKAAIGTPVGSFPQGLEADSDKTDFITALRNLSTNEQNYIVKPAEWEIDIVKNQFDADKMLKVVDYEDGQIAGAALVSFLELGKGGGAYALSQDLSDVALLATKFVGQCLSDAMNRPSRELCEMNFGNAELCPIIKIVGIDKKAGKEFAEVVTSFINAGAVRIDNRLENYLRKVSDLPEAEKPRDDNENPPTGGSPNQPAPNNPQNPGKTSANKSGKDSTKEAANPAGSGVTTGQTKAKAGKFQDDFSAFRAPLEYEGGIDFTEMEAEFVSEERKLHNLMTTKLTSISVPVLKDFANRLKNRKGSRVEVAKKIIVDVSGYKKALENDFSRQVSVGVKSGIRDLNAKIRKYAPKDEQSKFSEIDLADKPKKGIEILPKGQKEALKIQAEQQARVHAEKMQQTIVFGSVNAENFDLSDDELIRDVEGKIDAFIKGQAVKNAAGTITTQNINKARAALFNDNSVQKVVAALMYSAVIDSGTTPICRSVDGIVFDLSESKNFAYTPPNHFGCRAILVPITRFEKKPDLRPLRPDQNNPALDKIRKNGKPLTRAQILKTKNLEETYGIDNYL